jgi:hypothetical protein
MLPAVPKTPLEPVLQPQHLHHSAVVLLPRRVRLQRLLPPVEVRVLGLHRLLRALRAPPLLQVLLLVMSTLGSQTPSLMPLAALSLLL